jgi:lipoprotein-releasing system ATP-binding protein
VKKILVAKELSKSFYSPHKIEILKSVSLEVEKGETIAIMGRSGEGKSTLLHLLGTLEKPCSGFLEICGQNALKTPASLLRSRHIGFIFQSFHLLEDDTVLENVLMPAKIARTPTNKHSAAYARALSLLEEIGLLPKASVFAKYLSGGEKQRVALARALCNDPDLLLADEPSGSLDHANSQVIHQLLIESAKKHQKGLVIVTHDKQLAELCDRTLILKEGFLHKEAE